MAAWSLCRCRSVRITEPWSPSFSWEAASCSWFSRAVPMSMKLPGFLKVRAFSCSPSPAGRPSAVVMPMRRIFSKGTLISASNRRLSSPKVSVSQSAGASTTGTLRAPQRAVSCTSRSPSDMRPASGLAAPAASTAMSAIIDQPLYTDAARSRGGDLARNCHALGAKALPLERCGGASSCCTRVAQVAPHGPAARPGGGRCLS
mmetsp:Transcript_59678/g.153710  ORF Transcript_59678/g.153710 Transcript_59678/m.153710 type:complete len:203 (+) Transcript_59678:630-1238(+)